MPADDGSGPDGWVKGNGDTMRFIGPDNAAYADTEAEVYFADEQSAGAAGFRPWAN